MLRDEAKGYSCEIDASGWPTDQARPVYTRELNPTADPDRVDIADLIGGASARSFAGSSQTIGSGG
jgi:hypothetical protein